MNHIMFLSYALVLLIIGKNATLGDVAEKPLEGKLGGQSSLLPIPYATPPFSGSDSHLPQRKLFLGKSRMHRNKPNSYGNGRTSYGKGPIIYGKEPITYGKVPITYGKGPITYGKELTTSGGRQNTYGNKWNTYRMGLKTYDNAPNGYPISSQYYGGWVPDYPTCCADCQSGDIRCLSTCFTVGCKSTSTCKAAGDGAYAAFCQRMCGPLLEEPFSFLPLPACRDQCAFETQNLCYANACQDYGCYAPDCAELAPAACY